MNSEQRSRFLFEALEQLGWKNANDIVGLIKRLERGLPAEDEFCVLCYWLGRCRLIHKLDQFLNPPVVGTEYRVPDLLSVFDVESRHVPVLIEIKTSNDNILSWTPEYLKSLERYADLLDLPLLIAWKNSKFWTLFEARNLTMARKNYNISFTEAMNKTLLGVLAGDFIFSFRRGVGAHFDYRKLSDWKDGSITCDLEAYFLNANGERHDGTDGVSLLFGCIDQEVQEDENDTHIRQSYVVRDDVAQFAHRALTILLDTYSDTKPPEWRQILLRKRLPLLRISPLQLAQNAGHAGFIQNIIHPRPKTLPDFLNTL